MSGPYIERCPHDKENPYSMTSNALIRDESLHPNVRWFLIYLLSMKDGWKVNAKQVINHVKGHRGCGRDKVYDWIKEACAAGYMKKEEWQEGGLNRCRYILSEYPKFKKCLPGPDSQDPVRRDPVSKYYKKEHIQNDYSEEDARENLYDKGSKSKKTPPPSADASGLAKYFFERIREMKPDFKPPNLTKWTKSFENILKLDKRSPEKIREVIDWLASSKAKFTYIQSPTKLRERFDEQEMRMNAERQSKIIDHNRQYAIYISKQYPKQYYDLTFNKEMVINSKTGLGLPFDIAHEEFKRGLDQLFGGNNG